MSTQPRCGLFADDESVPLEGVRVAARLRDACVEVTVTQRYRNAEAVPVEAVYVFPLDEAAAVCGFAAKIGERLVRGQVREREQAFSDYDDALHAGDGAYLLDQERPNVFTASVGNLRPGEAVELQIRYVALASREGAAIRLAIPTTVSPRYVPKAPSRVGQTEGERVNPEHWPAVPYGLTLEVDVEGERLRRLESPSHPVRTVLRDGGARVELAQDDAALDRDFVLLVEREAPARPLARVAREADGRRVLMLGFVPEEVASAEQGHEVLFLLDCSGSMMGDSIAQAKRALALCIRALHASDSFNVICFGSSFQTMWSTARALDQASLDESTKHLAKIDANLGGTEILAPLQHLLEAKADAKRPRRVIVLTDGQVSNEDAVLALARKHAGDTRIFAFGIGAGASEYLVRGMARASRGAAEMIFPGERIEPKVLRTLTRVRTPVLDGVRVDYRGLTVQQAPARTPPVFAGEVLTVFARVDAGTTSSVALTIGDKAYEVEVDLERAESDGPIPTLWARERIRELEESDSSGSQQRRGDREERRRSQLIELGERYGLLSSATSYVAIEQRPEHERTHDPAALRRIPVALTHGWGGGRNTPPGAPMRMMSVMAGGMAPAPAPSFAGMEMMRAAAPMASGAAPAGLPPTFGESGGGESENASLVERARRLFKGRARAKQDTGAPPAPSSDALAGDRLFDLLMTQRADGSFAPSPVLDAWLGSERSARLIEACRTHGEALAVTLTVLALLEREASDRASEWQPAALKARAWSASQSSQLDATTIVAL